MHPQHTGNIELGGVSETPEDHDTQMGVERLEKWTNGNLLKFSEGTCRVLPLERNSPRHQDTLRVPGWKAALQRRPWGSWWTPH